MSALVGMGEGVRGVQVVQQPYVSTSSGNFTVEEGKHYIVVDENGERYPVEREAFEREYELLED